MAINFSAQQKKTAEKEKNTEWNDEKNELKTENLIGMHVSSFCGSFSVGFTNYLFFGAAPTKHVLWKGAKKIILSMFFF